MRTSERVAWGTAGLRAAELCAIGLCASALLLTACTADPPKKAIAIAVDGPASPEIGWQHNPERAERAPISLTASDGTGLVLASLSARTVIEDPLAFTELHLTFHNPEPRRREGRFEITLPQNAAISRFAMAVRGGLQEGEVVERKRAQQVYEDFLHRKQDPALLEKAAGNEFSARIFPIEAHENKEIIVAYSEELPQSGAPYRLPLQGLPTLGELNVEVRVSHVSQPGAAGGEQAAKLELHERNYVPEADLEVRLPRLRNVALRSGDLVVARVTPVLSLPAATFSGLTVLFDTSASRALGFGSQIERLSTLLAALQTRAGQDFELRVLAFDQSSQEIYRGPVSGFGAREQKLLLDRDALGASDLSQALSQVARGAAGAVHERLLVVTDGMITAGPDDTTSLREAVAKLAAHGTRRLDVLGEGGIQDQARLQALTRAGLPNVGVVLSSREGASQLASAMLLGTRDDVEVRIAGASWVYPQKLEGVQPGDQYLVFAELPAQIPVQIELANAGADAFETLQAPAPLIERAVARARIEALTSEHDALPEDNAGERARLEQAIVALSVGSRVVSDYTALLVLETEHDYARFGIAQNALTSILRVGDTGIEVFDRKGLGAHDLRRLRVAQDFPEVEPEAESPVEEQGFPEGSVVREEAKKSDDANAQDLGARVASDGLGVRGVGVGGGGVANTRARRTSAAPMDPATSAAAPSAAPPAPSSPAKAMRAEAPPIAASEAEASASLRSQPTARADKATGSLSRDEADTFAPSAAPPPAPAAKPATALTEQRRAASQALGSAGDRDDLAGLGSAANVGAGPTSGPTTRGSGAAYRPADRPDSLLQVAAPALRARATLLVRHAFGLSTSEARQSLAALKSRAQRCYETSGNPEQAERLVIELSISDKGTVSDAYVISGTRGEPSAQACVVAAARTLRFPKPEGGNASVQAGVELAMEQVAPQHSFPVGAVSTPHARPLSSQRPRAVSVPSPRLDEAYGGALADVLAALARGDVEGAMAIGAVAHADDPGDVIALVALGEACEAKRDFERAARVYGSLIDLFPGRPDLRRMASGRLERLPSDAGLALAVDSYQRALAQRPDHPSAHRALAYAQWKAGKRAEALDTLDRALDVPFREDRFEGAVRILREDLGMLAAAYLRADPSAQARVQDVLERRGIVRDAAPSLRFVLSWETDANDVDFHIHDGRGGHAYYMKPKLGSGGSLYADITSGYGPECFTVPGSARNYPYVLQAHYYARGPMGYGMGKVQVIEHDGQGTLKISDHPFVIMKDKAFVELLRMKKEPTAQLALGF